MTALCHPQKDWVRFRNLIMFVGAFPSRSGGPGEPSEGTQRGRLEDKVRHPRATSRCRRCSNSGCSESCRSSAWLLHDRH